MREDFQVAAQPPETVQQFRPNIDNTGRWVRGLASFALFIGAAFALRIHLVLGVVLFLSAGFLLFEASRGWCALRACGIRTRF